MRRLANKLILLIHNFKKLILKSNNYKAKHIAPLSPTTPDNYNEEEYDVYSDYLKKAFSNSSIRNIAITGNYGIGKSSFIKKWSNKKKFLFISLCNFSESTSKNLECDLLQQLLLGCGYVAKKDNNVEREWSKMKTFLALVLCFSISATIYFLAFYDIFKPTFDILKCILFEMLKPLFGELILPLSHQSIDIFKGFVYSLFSISMIVGLSIIIFKLIRHYRLTKFAFKLENTEIETECTDKFQSSYMDRHRLDLVYALRQAAKQIDYTIIFEDMDRLAPITCCSLFTELREINRLINSSGFGKKSKKTMRFIYVIHDAVFCNKTASDDSHDQLIHLKFFDYIIPIVPSIIKKSSSNYITNCFNAIDFNHVKFTDTIARHLFDYRLIKNITNEYSVLKDIYLARNDLTNLTSTEEQQLMALIIYKVLLPTDYKNIRESKSMVFLSTSIVAASSAANDTVKCLISNGWLSYDCLKFVGYNISEIKKYIEKIFDFTVPINSEYHKLQCQLLREDFRLCYEIIINKLNENENIAPHLNSIRYTLLEMILERTDVFFFKEFLYRITSSSVLPHEYFESSHKRSLMLFMKTIHKTDNLALEKLTIVIEYLMRINHNDFDWFFTNLDSIVPVPTLDDFRWKIICSLSPQLLGYFISQAQDNLISWLNTFSNQASILKTWRSDCSKETATALAKLEFDQDIKNWINSLS